MLFNSPELRIPNTRVFAASTYSDQTKVPLFGSTAFSLPFERSINLSQLQRSSWLRKRLLVWRCGLRRSLKHMLVTFSSIQWLVFLAKGDRQLLGLPRYELLTNGIFINYIEVERTPGAHDDFYRRVLLVNIMQDYISFYRNHMQTAAIVTCRIDSDDILHPRYCALLSSCIRLQTDSLLDVTYAFPHGLEFDIEKGTLIPKMWPEPPFIARYEKHCSNSPLKTVWEKSHDQQDLNKNYAQIMTTEPVWCITLGNDNIQNSSSMYPYCRAYGMNITDIFRA